MELKLKIVSFLSRNTGKTFTINEIAKFLHEYYSFVHRIMGKLIRERVVIKTKAGKSHLCSLDIENEKTTTLIQLSEIENRDEFYSKSRELKLILEDLVKSINLENVLTIALFGSYAKGSQTKESDIDIFILAGRKFNIDKTAKELYAKYGKEMNALVMTPKEFKKEKGKPVIEEIIKDHYVLHGIESFVKMVFGK